MQGGDVTCQEAASHHSMLMHAEAARPETAPTKGNMYLTLIPGTIKKTARALSSVDRPAPGGPSSSVSLLGLTTPLSPRRMCSRWLLPGSSLSILSQP